MLSMQLVLKQLISEVKKSGDGIEQNASVSGFSMRQMPGIIELFETESAEEKKKVWSFICDYVIETKRCAPVKAQFG